MLTRRRGMCWLRRWRRTSGWPSGRRSCGRTMPGCGRSWRAAALSLTGSMLSWRCCSGWYSAGPRSGCGPMPQVAGTRAAIAPAAVTAEGSPARGRRQAGGTTRICPGRGDLGLRGRQVLVPAVRGAVRPAGRSRRGAAGPAGGGAGGRALPPPQPAGLRLPGPGDGDGARPAEGDRPRGAGRISRNGPGIPCLQSAGQPRFVTPGPASVRSRPRRACRARGQPGGEGGTARRRSGEVLHRARTTTAARRCSSGSPAIDAANSRS